MGRGEGRGGEGGDNFYLTFLFNNSDLPIFGSQHKIRLLIFFLIVAIEAEQKFSLREKYFISNSKMNYVLPTASLLHR